MRTSLLLGLPAFMLFFLFFMAFAEAATIGVGVAGSMSIDAKIIQLEEHNDIIAFYVGAHNTGSVGYGSRARMDIMSGSKVLFTGWSSAREMNPGSRRGFVIYAKNPNVDNMTIRARAYYGNEIEELATMKLDENKNKTGTSTAFGILNFKVYEDYLRFDLVSNRSLDNVVVIPGEVSGAWIIEQKNGIKIAKGQMKEVIIPYHTERFREINITIATATEDGSHYQEHEFTMVRQSGLSKYVNLILDYLGRLFRF